MCSTKITRDNFIATFGDVKIEIQSYSRTYYSIQLINCLGVYVAHLATGKNTLIGKPMTTLGEVHALYKALMHKDFKLK